MVVLGIETSCDDSAAAVLADGVLRSSVVSSQDRVHGPFGGVVPELASREHLKQLVPVIDAALTRAGVTFADLDGIAVTRGPGLVGSLLVGVSVAKAIALRHGLPIVGVNHLEGHVLAPNAERGPGEAVEHPFLALVVSGGHSALYLARAPGEYACVGRTRDDAVGEAFDKVAKTLGLAYPGGPVIDRLARTGDPRAIRFPRARMKRGRCELSFSGFKTAVWQWVRANRPREADLPNVAASVQEALVDMCVRAAEEALDLTGAPRLVVTGGVSANRRLRDRVRALGDERGVEVIVPPPALCTDNAAMIAVAGARRLAAGENDGLGLEVDASLPLGAAWAA